MSVTALEAVPKEYELLKLFLSQPGVAFTREQLLQKVWNTEYPAETRTVDMHIRTLRQKPGKPHPTGCGFLFYIDFT